MKNRYLSIGLSSFVLVTVVAVSCVSCSHTRNTETPPVAEKPEKVDVATKKQVVKKTEAKLSEQQRSKKKTEMKAGKLSSRDFARIREEIEKNPNGESEGVLLVKKMVLEAKEKGEDVSRSEIKKLVKEGKVTVSDLQYLRAQMKVRR